MGALRQSAKRQQCVLDDVLRAQERRRRLRRGGLAVVMLVLVVLADLVLNAGRPPGAGVARTRAVTATQAPVGSGAAALMLARQMLARLEVPSGSRSNVEDEHPGPFAGLADLPGRRPRSSTPGRRPAGGGSRQTSAVVPGPPAPSTARGLHSGPARSRLTDAKRPESRRHSVQHRDPRPSRPATLARVPSEPSRSFRRL